MDQAGRGGHLNPVSAPLNYRLDAMTDGQPWDETNNLAQPGYLALSAFIPTI